MDQMNLESAGSRSSQSVETSQINGSPTVYPGQHGGSQRSVTHERLPSVKSRIPPEDYLNSPSNESSSHHTAHMGGAANPNESQLRPVPKKAKIFMQPPPSRVPVAHRTLKQPFSGSPYLSSSPPVRANQIIKITPVSGSLTFPAFPVKVGTPWDLVFLNLSCWLPELAGINDQNSVMLQYKTDNGWRPLAGDEQLKAILEEFSSSGWDLLIRCAPEDEFESSPETEVGDEIANHRSYGLGSGGLVMSSYMDNKKTVSQPTCPLSSCGFDCSNDVYRVVEPRLRDLG